MNIEIKRITDIDLLMPWRMEVLHCVFSIPADADTSELECANRHYYEAHLADGRHIACLAYAEGVAVGCGGVCFYGEMPSPDNPSGKCAYLMNIYVRPEYRREGIALRIVRWLVDQALAHGISKIYLETSDSGRKLYSTLGFRYMKDMMKLETV